MRGRDKFNSEELAWIRDELAALRQVDREEQKRIRRRLRAQGFWISDWTPDGDGFTVTDLDELLRSGRIVVDEGAGRLPPPVPATDTGFGDMHHRAEPDDIQSAVDSLRPPGTSIADAFAGAVPDAPGLYALYADANVWQQLALGSPPDDRPLYIGKAEGSLVNRDLRTHFTTGKTGSSSPRRSLAALLAETLELVPTPRKPERPDPTKWTHYGLEPDGDERLTRWMHTHLRLACWASDGAVFLHDVERGVMRHWQPPLNLTGVKQPYRRQVLDAREVLALRAYTWARDRGLVE